MSQSKSVSLKLPKFSGDSDNQYTIETVNLKSLNVPALKNLCSDYGISPQGSSKKRADYIATLKKFSEKEEMWTASREDNFVNARRHKGPTTGRIAKKPMSSTVRRDALYGGGTRTNIPHSTSGTLEGDAEAGKNLIEWANRFKVLVDNEERGNHVEVAGVRRMKTQLYSLLESVDILVPQIQSPLKSVPAVRAAILDFIGDLGPYPSIELFQVKPNPLSTPHHSMIATQVHPGNIIGALNSADDSSHTTPMSLINSTPIIPMSATSVGLGLTQSITQTPISQGTTQNVDHEPSITQVLPPHGPTQSVPHGPNTSITHVITLHSGPLQYTAENLPSAVPTAGLPRTMDGLLEIWDDSRDEWKRISPLLLNNVFIALKYWPKLGWPSAVWESGRHTWTRRELVYQEYMSLGREGFTEKWSDEHGNMASVPSIANKIEKKLKEERTELAREAHAKYTTNFTPAFSYMKGGRSIVLSSPAAIARQYGRLQNN